MISMLLAPLMKSNKQECLYFKHSKNPHIHHCIHPQNTFSVCGYKRETAHLCPFHLPKRII
jgi:hypothetical protein